MKKSNLIQRGLLFIALLIVMINTNAQTGLNFQGVARTSNNVILASQAITIKLSILQGSAIGTAEYTETRRVATNAQGLFTAVIGDTGAISTLGNFTSINWKLTPKFLKIEMDPAAGTNFITMGTTQFQYVAYAQFSKSVDAENIVGIVPVSLGGTGVNSLTSLKTALVVDKVNNTTDASKPISTATQTALDLKSNASDVTTSLSLKAPLANPTFTGTVSGITKTMVELGNVDNTSDALKPISTATQAALDLKSSLIDISKYTKQTYSDSALLTKLNITGNAATATSATSATTAGTASTANKLATARKINNVDFDGSGDITVTSDAGTLTGTTLKSTIIGSSLTSVGTLASATVNGKVIVGASSAASTSAVLEANSTTQGFLPPRMTYAQRMAITSPATGLVVFCTDCGQQNDPGELEIYFGGMWRNMSGSAALTSVPIVASTAPIDIFLSTATSGGNITSDGGSAITARGVCWSTSQNPTTANFKTIDAGTTGAFTSSLTGLVKGNTYYIRSYATNVSGTVYGSQHSFKTFDSVIIGTQTWINRNWDQITYRNGDTIPNVTDDSTWASLTTGAWCYYNNDSTQYAKYGKLYNWYAVNDPRGLVPIGWHVPNDDDWATLEINLGGYEIAGGKMKEVGTLNWLSPNTEATNESGFSGLPGGARWHNNGAFDGGVGYGGGWWSSTNVPFDPNFLGANFAWHHYLVYNRGMLYSKRYHSDISWKLVFDRKSGFSVRLLKD